MNHRFWLAVITWGLLAFTGRAEVPPTVNYQGRLLDDSGVPVNGQVNIVVEIYTNLTIGAAVYTQNLGLVTVENGTYSFNFGSDLPGMQQAFGASEAWLEVNVDGSPLLPRQRIVAVPYAIEAASVSGGSPVPTGGIVLSETCPNVELESAGYACMGYSEAFSNWVAVTESAPWTERWGPMGVVHDSEVWIMGGRTPAGESARDVWRSTDGSNWNLVTASAGWTNR